MLHLECIHDFFSVSQGILRSKFDFIIELLENALESYESSSLFLRSYLTCLEFLFLAQEPSSWSLNLILKKSFSSLLSFSLDARPKIRKRALDALRRILSSPPPPCFVHPGISHTLDYFQKMLDSNEDETVYLHFLLFLNVNGSLFMCCLENEKFGNMWLSLVQSLLLRSRKSVNARSSSMLFNVLQNMIVSLTWNESNLSLQSSFVDLILRSIMEMKPYHNDATLIPLWLELLGNCFCQLGEMIYHFGDYQLDYSTNVFPDLLISFFNKCFNAIYTSDETKDVIKSTATVVLCNLLLQSVSQSMSMELKEKDQHSKLYLIVKTLSGSLENIKFRNSLGFIITICESFVARLGKEHPKLCLDMLLSLGKYRDDANYASSFPFKEELDSFLSCCVQELGMEMFLSAFPLNILNEFPDQPRRPYLLSLFRKALQRPCLDSLWISKSLFGSQSLGYYQSHLMSLSQNLFEKSQEMFLSNKELESKLYETLGIQCLELFPVLCATVPSDLASHFSKLAPNMAKILQSNPTEMYPDLPSHPDLRWNMSEALEKLISSFNSLNKVSKDEESNQNDMIVYKEEEKQILNAGIATLKEYANRFLSILCNIFTTIPMDIMESAQKGQALQFLYEKQNHYIEKTITALLSIANEKDVADYFISLVQVLMQLQTKVPNEQDSVLQTQLEQLRMYAILDLLLLLLAYLPKDSSHYDVFYSVLEGQLVDSDSTLQKKTYKSLATLLDYMTLSETILNQLSTKLLDPTIMSLAGSGSKRARIQLIQKTSEAIPYNSSHFLLEWLPTVLPEIILSTKEANEKARQAAFDCIVAFGKRMISGSPSDTISMTLDSENKRSLDIKEYFLMVIAGLAGSTPHMQSATIGCLSRLVFEFQGIYLSSFIFTIKTN